MSAFKKRRTAAEDTPTASSTPTHPWVAHMAKHNWTLEEVAEHAYTAANFPALSYVQEKQAKFKRPTPQKAVKPVTTYSSSLEKPAKKPVRVFLKNEKEAQTFDFLVVAANPRELMGYGLSGGDPTHCHQVMAPTKQEEAIYSKAGGMHNSYFQTTVIKVPPSSPVLPNVVRFVPAANSKATGEVMGFRNETAKTYWVKGATEEYVTFYQLSDPEQPCATLGQAALEAKFNDFIKDPPDWCPYTMPKETPTVFNTAYFNRFPKESLDKGLPWDLLDLQGQTFTSFTHGSSCFESVLQIYQYLEMLEEKGGLPTDKTASVAIVGAGPSGLLSALFLTRKGFTDITVFEKNHDPEEDKPNLYTGKTRTVVKKQGVDEQEVVCEMGTCYLSPSYAPMVNDLKDFFDGTMYAENHNVYPLDQNPEKDPSFRGLIATDQFAKDGPVQRFADLLGEGVKVPKGANPFKDEGFTSLVEPIDFAEYCLLKAMEETCIGPPKHGPLGGKVPLWEVKLAYNAQRLECTIGLAKDMVKYNLIHNKLFGDATPFPAERIPETKMKAMTMTFRDWLEFNGLLRLTGFLQYGYSVQGYGTLENIPAWYGLVWVQPSTLWQALSDKVRAAVTKFVPHVDLTQKGEVFALKKGWGQVWENMRPVLKSRGVKFKWSAVLERIERDGV